MKIGIDLVECDRVKKLVNAKIFSPAELEYIQSKNQALETIAGLFGAKEAYFKAQGTGIIWGQLPQIEVAHTASGQPYYLHDPNAILSISHTKTTAVAVCIIF